MDKKMTVKEFVDKYTSLVSEVTKENLINSLKITEYIPYERKADLCKALVNSSSYDKKEDEYGNVTRTFKRDSILEYMMLNLMLVKEYTDIEVDYKKNIEEFNLLNAPSVTMKNADDEEITIGLIDAIISRISDRELQEFKMILDLTKRDLMQNEYETHAFIRNQVDRFSDVFKVLIKTAEPVLLEMSNKISNMNEKDIEKFSNKIIKLIK